LALGGWFALRSHEPALAARIAAQAAQAETRSGHADAPASPRVEAPDLTLARSEPEVALTQAPAVQLVKASTRELLPARSPRAASRKLGHKPKRSRPRQSASSPAPSRLRYDDQLKDPF
jgi:hypothetical protein